ncbi:MAG: decarboxylase, partial [Bradymonadaceae bacterium]
GAEVFGTASTDEKLDLAERAARRIGSMEALRLIAAPQLSTLAFRAAPDGIDESEVDRFNRRVLETVNRRGRVHLSGTSLDGRFTLRLSILSFRTHAEDVDAALDELEKVVDRVDD